MKSMLIIFAMLFLLAACSDTGTTPIITRPKAPANAVATLIAPRVIQLVWEDHADNEDGFIISRGSRKFGWIEIIRTKEPNVVIYLDTFEAPPLFSSAGRVSYLVQSYNQIGDSQMAISNEVTYNQ